MDGVSATSYKTSNGLRHAQSMDNVSWAASPRKKYYPPLVKGSRGKPTWASLVNDHDEVIGDDGMGSSDALYRSGDFGQEQQLQNHGNTDELVSASVRPFNNNPTLPTTQRDIVGNNLQFKSSSPANDWANDENDQLAALLLYRDALKRNLTTAAKAGGGLPRMRHGRIGSQWRHIKQTNTYSGSNLMFVDGTVRIDDTFKFPMPRFGYPPLKRPQHPFSSSYNDLSTISSNPATKSLDAMGWSNSESHQPPRPSASQHASHLHHQGNHSFGEHDYHEVIQPTSERNKYGLH